MRCEDFLTTVVSQTPSSSGAATDFSGHTDTHAHKPKNTTNKRTHTHTPAHPHSHTHTLLRARKLPPGMLSLTPCYAHTGLWCALEPQFSAGSLLQLLVTVVRPRQKDLPDVPEGLSEADHRSYGEPNCAAIIPRGDLFEH